MIRLAKHTQSVATDDGLVLLDARRGKYWHLNSSGARILDLLLAGSTETEAIETVVDETGAPRELVGHDVRELVNGLRKARLAEATP